MTGPHRRTIRAVVFDMDGLLLDSEVYWERARREFCRAHGCDWAAGDELGVKGANSPEWAAKILQRCHFSLQASAIIEGVGERMRQLYDDHLPLLPGAVETVQALAGRYPLAIASSSPLDLIEFATERAGLRSAFRIVVSADSAGRGKPSPDVFLAAAGQLQVPPSSVAVFEDSSAGISAGRAAGMYVIAVPNAHYPPSADALAMADLVLDSLQHFDPAHLHTSTERPVR